MIDVISPLPPFKGHQPHHKGSTLTTSDLPEEGMAEQLRDILPPVQFVCGEACSELAWLVPFCRWSDWGLERLGNLLKIM